MQAAAPFVETLAMETANLEETPTETVQELSSPITQLIEIPIAATPEQILSMTLAPTAFEMTLPLEEILQTGAILTSDDAPSAAKLDPSFANDHWDENLYAFLADMQAREQRRNDIP